MLKEGEKEPMYVLLSSIIEILNASCDIVVLLDDAKSMDQRRLAEIEKQLLQMIRCALGSYEQLLEACQTPNCTIAMAENS